jgi:hypothetical protein
MDGTSTVEVRQGRRNLSTESKIKVLSMNKHNMAETNNFALLHPTRFFPVRGWNWNHPCRTQEVRYFSSTSDTDDETDNDDDDDDNSSDEEAVDSDSVHEDNCSSDDDDDDDDEIDSSPKINSSKRGRVPQKGGDAEKYQQFEKKTQENYRKWKAGVGKPPHGILFNSAGVEVFSPQISPDYCITGRDETLPPAIQAAVKEHVYWACEHEYIIPKDRNMVRHHRLDSRDSLKKGKKKFLKKEIVATPFVLIGAYRNLLRRARQYPYGNDKEDLAGSNIRNAKIPSLLFKRCPTDSWVFLDLLNCQDMVK